VNGFAFDGAEVGYDVISFLKSLYSDFRAEFFQSFNDFRGCGGFSTVHDDDGSLLLSGFFDVGY